MLNNSSKIINAKAALDSLYKTDNENIINNESEIDIIRNLFDDIVKLRKRRIKLECIYQSLVDSGINITFSNFTTALSRIRKERGIEIRKRSSNKVKSTTPLSLSEPKPTLKSESNNLGETKDDINLIDDGFISPLAEKDRSHYTSDDYQAELDLLEKLISENNRDKHKMYRILNGDLDDIKQFDLNTVSGRRQCHAVVNRLLNRERRKYLELIRIVK